MNPTVARHSMDIWGPRQAASLREARRRTALVHIVRLLFTVGAVLAAGLLIGPAIQHAISAGAPKYSAPALSETMLHPQFEGRDNEDRLYIVTADTARRRRDNVNLVDLVNPRLTDETATSVQAQTGVYDRAQEILDLKGDVVMEDQAGYRFTAEASRMYLRDNRVEGTTQMHGIGPIGEVRADSYEVRNNGDEIVLRGNVWTQFKTRQRGR